MLPCDGASAALLLRMNVKCVNMDLQYHRFQRARGDGRITSVGDGRGRRKHGWLHGIKHAWQHKTLWLEKSGSLNMHAAYLSKFELQCTTVKVQMPCHSSVDILCMNTEHQFRCTQDLALSPTYHLLHWKICDVVLSPKLNCDS